MNKTINFAAIVMCLLPALPLHAAEDDAKARGQFKTILEAFNTRSFEKLEPAFDKTDLINRVVAVRPVSGQLRDAFSAQFQSIVDVGFRFSLHNLNSDDSGEVVDFDLENGIGRGVIRVRLPRHEYAYLVFDLRHDRRGRLKIVDWFDSRRGQTLTTSINELLVSMQPTKAETRVLLGIPNPTDLQLFQATELLKAARDSQEPRFLEIYDGFTDEIKRHPLIAKFAMRFAARGNDPDRFVNTLKVFVDVYAGDQNFAAVTSDYYLQVQALDKAFDALKVFHENFDVQEGAIPARLSALALAIRRPEEAEKYAVEATTDEPTLELAWWSLLRARAGAGDFEGSVAALSYLEDHFGHRLDAAKLKRDPYKAFDGLAASQAFLDWRAGR